MKIFITGASGYVGNKLAHSLAETGNEVHAIIRSQSAEKLLQHPNIKIFPGDLLNKESLLAAMDGCEHVYHTAAFVKLYAKNRSDFYDVNVEGTRHVLNTALKTGAKKLVFTSTCSVIGPSVNEPMSEKDPRITGFQNDYDFSKYLAEKLVTEYNSKDLFTVIANASKVFGPGIETHPLTVNGLIRQFISGKLTFCPSPTSFVSNYVFINDLVKGHILALEKGKGGEKYIIGGENMSYAEFFDVIRNVSGKKGHLIPAGKNIGRIYGWWHFIQSKLCGKDPFFTSRGVNQIFCNKSFTSAKAERELGYIITPFPSALESTIQFLKDKSHV